MVLHGNLHVEYVDQKQWQLEVKRGLCWKAFDWEANFRCSNFEVLSLLGLGLSEWGFSESWSFGERDGDG